MQTLLLITTEFAAVAHFIFSLVLFRFAVRSVRFLSQAWIMLIFSIFYGAATVFLARNGVPQLGILNPMLLIYLLAASYLQSIYPLGLCMPGYLQWGRMWQYATPAIALIFIYSIGASVGSDLSHVYELEDLLSSLLSGDVLLRLAALCLSGYYIINIFRLPHKLVRQFELPRDLVSYGLLLGGSCIFFVTVTIWFSIERLIVYEILFTGINIFLSFRILRPVILSMDYPQIKPVEAPPSPEAIAVADNADFNAANFQRFEAIEYLMQHERPYLDYLFNRERLCRMAGYNRHVVLQTLRSQGYNDIHEYIARYRVAELRRQTLDGRLADLKDCEQVGFRTLKTAAASFERYEGGKLEEWFALHRGEESKKKRSAQETDPQPGDAANL
ncbi:MAG: hypothetical protein J1F06_01030 [Prevotellaceae bacterium]|nr:hypothetical protein [Prevotellaceae bacterium]